MTGDRGRAFSLSLRSGALLLASVLLHLLLEELLEIHTRSGLCARGDLLGCAFGDDVATRLTSLRAHIDDPVGSLDDLKVVLDDDHRVSLIDEGLQSIQQGTNIVEV